MDKTNLSKRKWIYNIYIGEDEQMHIERFPIIYMNKDWVYVKRPGTPALFCLRIVEVFNEPDLEQRITFYRCIYGRWFWEVPDATKRKLLTKAKTLTHVLREEAVKELESRLQRYEAEMAILQKKLKDLNEM